MRTLRLVILLATACAARADAVPLRVLARPGDVATDGTSLGALSDLASIRGGLAVRATTRALVQVAGETRTVLVRTADPLPAPLTGRFDDVDAADVAVSGAVIFRASIDSPDGSSGLFQLDDAGLRVLTLDIPRARTLTANDAGDVLLSTTSRLVQWRRSDGTTSTLARVNSRLPDGSRLRRLGHDVGLTGDGTVVFTAWSRPRTGRARNDIIAIYLLPAIGPPTVLAQAPVRASRLGLTRPIMGANSQGDVAHILGFGSAAGVFVHPGTALLAPVRVAGPGDAVGTRVLDRPLPGLVAIDDLRRVTFLAQLDDGPHVVLADAAGLRSLAGPLASADLVGAGRLPDSAAVVWRTDVSLFRVPDGVTPLVGPSVDLPPLDPGFAVRGTPAVNRDGVAVVTVERTGLYELTSGGAVPLLEERDLVDGGQVVEILDHGAGGDGRLVALADIEPGDITLLLRHDTGRWAPLVADGGPTSRGDTVSLFELPPLDTRRGEVVAALTTSADPLNRAPYTLRPGALPVPLLDAGALGDVSGVVALRDTIVFAAGGPEDMDSALHRLQRGRVRPLVRPGQRVGGRQLGSIYELQAAGNGIVFRALLKDTVDAVFAWRPGAPLRRLDRPSWPSLDTLIGGPDLLAGIGSRDDSGPSGLYLLAGRRVRRLAVSGEPSPSGGPLDFGAGELAFTRRGVAFLEGSAVLEARFPRRPAPR